MGLARRGSSSQAAQSRDTGVMSPQRPHWGSLVIELSRNLLKVFTITERAFSWYKVPASAFTFRKL